MCHDFSTLIGFLLFFLYLTRRGNFNNRGRSLTAGRGYIQRERERESSRFIGVHPGYFCFINGASHPPHVQNAVASAHTQPQLGRKSSDHHISWQAAGRQSATQHPRSEPAGKRAEASLATSKRKQKVKASELRFLRFLDMHHRLV